MQRPVMTPIGEAHAEDHGQDIANSDEHPYRHLVEFFHLQQAGDHVGFDGHHGHGDGVVQDDDASFALSLDKVHLQECG